MPKLRRGAAAAYPFGEGEAVLAGVGVPGVEFGGWEAEFDGAGLGEGVRHGILRSWGYRITGMPVVLYPQF